MNEYLKYRALPLAGSKIRMPVAHTMTMPFLIKINSSGTELWAAYYGGTGGGDTRCCITDANGNVYLAGIVISGSGLATGGFQNTFGVPMASGNNRCWLCYITSFPYWYN